MAEDAFDPTAFMRSATEILASMGSAPFSEVMDASNLTRPGPVMITSELDDSTVMESTELEMPVPRDRPSLRGGDSLKSGQVSMITPLASFPATLQR